MRYLTVTNPGEGRLVGNGVEVPVLLPTSEEALHSTLARAGWKRVGPDHYVQSEADAEHQMQEGGWYGK